MKKIFFFAAYGCRFPFFPCISFLLRGLRRKTADALSCSPCRPGDRSRDFLSGCLWCGGWVRAGGRNRRDDSRPVPGRIFDDRFAGPCRIAGVREGGRSAVGLRKGMKVRSARRIGGFFSFADVRSAIRRWPGRCGECRGESGEEANRRGRCGYVRLCGNVRRCRAGGTCADFSFYGSLFAVPEDSPDGLLARSCRLRNMTGKVPTEVRRRNLP